jgi:hypothetical protein
MVPLRTRSIPWHRAGSVIISSAGNDNQESYDSNFAQIADRRARRLTTPVHLEQVPAELTAGGFHNFGTRGNPDVVQQISTAAFGADYLVLQWNDDPNGLGGVDDTFATDAAFQEAFLPGPSDADPAPVYYIAYAKASAQATRADRIRSLAFFGNAQYVSHTRPFSPQVYGHTAANGAVSVAADYWNDWKGTEYFSSLGPVSIYFDSDGSMMNKPMTGRSPPASGSSTRARPSAASGRGMTDTTSLP